MTIKVKLLSFYGSDRAIAERAWVSTNKAQDRTDEDVARVLKFIVFNKHTRPLELAVFSFSIECDIATDRQICTHRMVTASMALSHRYCDAKEKFYTPEGLEDDAALMYHDALKAAYKSYNDVRYQLVLDGFAEKRAREIARNLLPMSLMTKRELDFNLLSLANFLRLRMDKQHAQLEVQMVASRIYNEVMAIPQLSVITKILDESGWNI